jgi:predicted 3-demethylubiquinone-9 3-methyltransferase (glyoxalase superfamily)
VQKITPFLWLDNNAEEAMNFYTSVFRDSKVLGVTHYGDAGPGPKGSVMTVTFTLNGQDITLLNGGPLFPQSPAFSFAVTVDTQEELDELWEKLLSGGGKPSQCGWLTDRFGVSWQIVPKIFFELSQNSDQKKSQRVMEAVLKMVKFDIAALKKAYAAG